MNKNTSVTLQDGAPEKRIAAAGSVIAAVLASSCCIVPLLLVSLGVSGALLKPTEGDCCVYCSYGDVKCPPIQQGSFCCS